VCHEPRRRLDVKNEINTRNLELEKSLDGKMFNTIATIRAKNKSRLVAEKYIQQDENPVEGTNYYRVKINDQEGYFNYSMVIKVFFENLEHGISVYPNPVNDGKI
jgi:hypothetical protein